MLLLFFFKFLQVFVYGAFDGADGDEFRGKVLGVGAFVDDRDAFHLSVLVLDNYIEWT